MPLAQINIARMLAPLESDVMQEFRDFLDPVNALAEGHAGFRWRYITALSDGSPENDERIQWEDNMVVINLSVWDDLESLHTFVYRTVHSYFVRNRKRWFAQMDRPHTVLWNVPEGYTPTLAEAREKLELLEREGPTAEAFTFARAKEFV